MKKLLLASTALVMSAGYAAADVSLSGNARMGLVYDGDDINFTSRARVIFTMSGETDGGLSFGATFRADQAEAADGSDMTGGNVFISSDFGTLTMGDVSGAAGFVVGDLAGVGLTDLRSLNENAFLSNAGDRRTAARYHYSLDGLTLAISADQPTADNNVYSIAASYEFDGFAAGLGYEQQSGAGNHIIGFVSGSFEGVTAKVTYGRIDSDQRDFLIDAGAAVESRNQYGLSVSGSFDEVSVTAFGRRDVFSNTHYGIGASYDLGGGASLVGGVVRDGGSTDAGKQTIADFGLSFTF